MAVKLEAAELRELYKIHVEEIRFQVKLNWDRTQYLLVLSIGILGVAASLWKTDSPAPVIGLIDVLFAVGAYITITAQAAMQQAHSYYRRAVLQKTKFELQLGLHEVDAAELELPPMNLTVSTTVGMERALQMSLNPEAFLNEPIFKRGQVSWYLMLFFRLLLVVNLAGLVGTWALSWKDSLLFHMKVRLGMFDVGLFVTIALGIGIPTTCGLLVLHVIKQRTAKNIGPTGSAGLPLPEDDTTRETASQPKL